MFLYMLHAPLSSQIIPVKIQKAAGNSSVFPESNSVRLKVNSKACQTACRYLYVFVLMMS